MLYMAAVHRLGREARNWNRMRFNSWDAQLSRRSAVNAALQRIGHPVFFSN